MHFDNYKKAGRTTNVCLIYFFFFWVRSTILEAYFLESLDLLFNIVRTHARHQIKTKSNENKHVQLKGFVYVPEVEK